MKLNSKHYIIIGVLLVIIALAAVYFITSDTDDSNTPKNSSTRVDSSNLKDGTVVFKYAEYDINEELTSEEEQIILDILDNKRLVKDNPSCGFDDDVSIRFNNGEEIFSIACDECGIIYWKNKDKYFGLTDSENETIRNILKEHGFVFPCV